MKLRLASGLVVEFRSPFWFFYPVVFHCQMLKAVAFRCPLVDVSPLAGERNCPTGTLSKRDASS